ncbi:MAG: hypothetical protein J3K34DRAFT_524930, partial [Monoraphidium minutum]
RRRADRARGACSGLPRRRRPRPRSLRAVPRVPLLPRHPRDTQSSRRARRRSRCTAACRSLSGRPTRGAPERAPGLPRVRARHRNRGHTAA